MGLLLIIFSLKCLVFLEDIWEHKDLPPFLIQLLIEKYTSKRSRDLLKWLKVKVVNSLSNLDTHNSIKAVKAAAIGEVPHAI